MAKARWGLTITPVDNGFLVQAGCVVVIKTADELGLEVNRWAHDPEKVEEEYLRKYRQEGAQAATIDPQPFLGAAYQELQANRRADVRIATGLPESDIRSARVRG